MPSIVPRNPAPIPGIYGPGPWTPGTLWRYRDVPFPPAPPTNRTYTGTDWARLTGRGSYWNPPTTETMTDENGITTTHEVPGYWNWVDPAVPPGFSEASIPSGYGAAWRGSAFGPSGRLAAPAPPRPAPESGPILGGPLLPPIVTYVPGWEPTVRERTPPPATPPPTERRFTGPPAPTTGYTWPGTVPLPPPIPVQTPPPGGRAPLPPIPSKTYIPTQPYKW